MQISNPKIQEIALEKMKPAPYNPREMSEEAKAGLSASMKRWGIVEPIVWNKKTGNVVGGHQRLKILKEQGVKKLPVVVVELEEKDEKALNLSLNNKQIQGDWTGKVMDLIEDLELEDPELTDGLLITDLRDTLDGTDFDFEEDEDEEVESKIPEMELQPFEHYDYILILADNVHDWKMVCDKLGIEKVNATTAGRTKSRKKIGIGRAVRAAKLLKALEAKK